MPREEWDWIYRNYELDDMPWHTIRPDRSLVKEGKIRPGLAYLASVYFLHIS